MVPCRTAALPHPFVHVFLEDEPLAMFENLSSIGRQTVDDVFCNFDTYCSVTETSPQQTALCIVWQRVNKTTTDI